MQSFSKLLVELVAERIKTLRLGTHDNYILKIESHKSSLPVKLMKWKYTCWDYWKTK